MIQFPLFPCNVEELAGIPHPSCFFTPIIARLAGLVLHLSSHLSHPQTVSFFMSCQTTTVPLPELSSNFSFNISCTPTFCFTQSYPHTLAASKQIIFLPSCVSPRRGILISNLYHQRDRTVLLSTSALQASEPIFEAFTKYIQTTTINKPQQHRQILQHQKADLQIFSKPNQHNKKTNQHQKQISRSSANLIKTKKQISRFSANLITKKKQISSSSAIGINTTKQIFKS
jgi:hypothetical protein